MTAKLMTRSGHAAPVIVELPSKRIEPESEHQLAVLAARQAVQVQFGPESRKVKRRMLRCHPAIEASTEPTTFRSEAYLLAASNNPLDGLAAASGSYPDATWCRIEDFRTHAREVASSLSLTVLATPSRA